MSYLDTVEAWIHRTTGRTLDQHAADPVPAAANLPTATDLLRQARSRLLLNLDALRTHLINGDDLTAPAQALTWKLGDLTDFVRDYTSARTHVDDLITDPDRTTFATTHPGRPIQRRYVNPGDTVLIVLPHTDACRRHHLAGRPTPVRVNEYNADVEPDQRSNPMRLPHAAAGIYRDPVASRLYVLRVAADHPTGSRR